MGTFLNHRRHLIHLKSCTVTSMLNLTQSNLCHILTFPESVRKQADDDGDDDDEDDEDDDDSVVKEENGVLVLNDANFDTFTADKDTVLLEFYAPWWVHSSTFLGAMSESCSARTSS